MVCLEWKGHSVGSACARHASFLPPKQLPLKRQDLLCKRLAHHKLKGIIVTATKEQIGFWCRATAMVLHVVLLCITACVHLDQSKWLMHADVCYSSATYISCLRQLLPPKNGISGGCTDQHRCCTHTPCTQHSLLSAQHSLLRTWG